jgi:hypothetical protein
MAEPIYKFFTVRFLEAWYHLSEEEQNGLEGKLDTALESVGAKRLILVTQGGQRTNGRLQESRSSLT